MYYNDHAPPHFHAIYGEYETTITIDTFEILYGKLPRRALALVLVLEWATLYRTKLQSNWSRARQGKPLQTIPPLE